MRSTRKHRSARPSARSQLEQNLRYVGIARDEGGTVMTGGEQLQLENRGYYMAPTVIADTAPDQRINCEEVFGPGREHRQGRRL